MRIRECIETEQRADLNSTRFSQTGKLATTDSSEKIMIKRSLKE